MVPELARISRCFDLQERHIAEAIAGREQTKRLLAHLAHVSAPDTGVAKVLLIYARMATTACDWVDGDLSIDLVEQGDATAIEAFTDLGGGLRERLFAPIRFDAPLTEFARAIARVPQMVSPLKKRSGARLIRLSVAESVRRTTAPPPAAIHIAAESLFRGAPRHETPAATGAVPPEGRLPFALPIVGRDRSALAADEVPEDAGLAASSPPVGLAASSPEGDREPAAPGVAKRPTDAAAAVKPSSPPIEEVDAGWDE